MQQIRYMSTEAEAEEFEQILNTLRTSCDMIAQIGTAWLDSGEFRFDAENTITAQNIQGLYFRNRMGYQHLRFRLSGNLMKELNEMFESALIEDGKALMISFLAYNEATGDTKQLSILNPVAMYGIPLPKDEESEYTVSYLFEDLLFGTDSLDVAEIENELEAEEAERELEEQLEERRLQQRENDLDALGFSLIEDEDNE